MLRYEISAVSRGEILRVFTVCDGDLRRIGDQRLIRQWHLTDGMAAPRVHVVVRADIGGNQRGDRPDKMCGQVIPGTEHVQLAEELEYLLRCAMRQLPHQGSLARPIRTLTWWGAIILALDLICP